MKKKGQVLLLVIILFTIIVVNIRSTLENYYGFYFSDKKDKIKSNVVYNALSFVEDSRLYNLFNTYTGLETGYGFFAPNVASEFIVDFTLYDKQNRVIAHNNMIDLKNKESVIRVSTALGLFLEVKPGDTSGMAYQKAIILLKGLSYKNLQQTKNACSIKADVYLFHYPMLAKITAKHPPEPLYYLYASKTYNLNSYDDWK